MRNLTDYKKKTGILHHLHDIPDSGTKGVPGSHYPQYIDVLHRQHAVIETSGVRSAKVMACGTSKTWQVTTGGSSRRTLPPT
jgi:hypothetical protein